MMENKSTYIYQGQDINITTDELNRLEPEICLYESLYNQIELKRKESQALEKQMNNDLEFLHKRLHTQDQVIYKISNIPYVIIKTLMDERNR